MIDITIITGLYGNGKSEFSLQYALYLKKHYKKKVYLGDLDVVNVYFRSREQTDFLKTQDIEVLGNVLGSKANTDVPLVICIWLTISCVSFGVKSKFL